MVSSAVRFGPVFRLVRCKWHPEMVFAIASSIYRRFLNG